MNENVTSIVGAWTNSYGSLMTIQQHFDTGLFVGSYSSTTGSSGLFVLVGYSPKVAQGNRPVSMGIYWRSLNPGTANPTYNWVSQLNGQFYSDTGRIELLHDMIASSAFSAIQVEQPGHYTETLVFTPYSGQEKGSAVELPDLSHQRTAPLTGSWANVDASATFQSVQLIADTGDAFLSGWLGTDFGSFPLIGLCDYQAPATMLQSMVVTANGANTNGTNTGLSLGGFYDPAQDQLLLIGLEAREVLTSNKYTSVSNAGSSVFARQ